MKNIILAFATFALLTSCSTDAVPSNDPVAPSATLKLASQVDFTNQTFVLDYNSNHTLHKATSENGEYLLAYQNSKISQIVGEMNGESFDVSFSYDANNQINSITANGVTKTVTYNEAGRFYEVTENPATLARVKYLLGNNGDLIEIQSFGNQGNFIDGKTYYYEDNQKGPMYNANRVTLHLAMACKNQALYSCAFAGYRPFKHFAGAHIAPMIMQNSFDSDGFVMGSIDNEDNFATFTYTHI